VALLTEREQLAILGYKHVAPSGAKDH